MQRYANWFRDAEGRGYPGAAVTVYNSGTSTLASIYSSTGSLTSPPAIGNPILTDSYGFFSFAVPNGTYDIQFQGSGLPTTVIPNVNLYEYVASVGTFANPMTTLGDVLYAGVAGAPTRLAGNTTAAAMYLRSYGSGGLATAPAFTAIAATEVSYSGSTVDAKLTNHESRITTLETASNPMTTLGDVVFGGTSGVPTRLAGNTTTTKKYLQSTGDGANATVPTFAQVAIVDVSGVQTQDATAFTTAGTAPAFTLTPTPALAAYAVNQRLHITVNADGTWGSNTIAISGLATKNLKQKDQLGNKVPALLLTGCEFDIQYDGTDFLVLNPLPIGAPSVRHTVMHGPVDTSGLPTFLPATSVNLNLTSQNIAAATPLIVTASNGGAAGAGQIDRYGFAVANLTWSGLTASQTNYLYVDIGTDGIPTTGATILPPIYQHGGTPAVTNGQMTYNIQERKMYCGNGSTASQGYRVFVGEAVAGASTVTSTVAYALNRISSLPLQAIPGTSSATIISHNLGTTLVALDSRVQCITTDQGYAVGDEISVKQITDSGRLSCQFTESVSGRNTVRISTASSTPYINPAAGGAFGVMATAKWNIHPVVKGLF
jgi:hypothetical protein